MPPRNAFWIPGGALHAVTATGVLEGYNAFVDPELDARVPEVCCAVSVTPLLRELLIRSASLPAPYEEGAAASRLVMVLLDEIASARVEDLHGNTSTVRFEGQRVHGGGDHERVLADHDGRPKHHCRL